MNHLSGIWNFTFTLIFKIDFLAETKGLETQYWRGYYGEMNLKEKSVPA